MSTEEPSILIVDDEAEDLEAVVEALAPLGYRLETLKDPHRVLAQVEAERPDLVILDALLPGLSGFDLCKRIKTELPGTDALVVILTGVYLKDQYRREARQQFKADGYFTKPFRPPDFQRQIAQLMSRKLKSRPPKAERSADRETERKGLFQRLMELMGAPPREQEDASIRFERPAAATDVPATEPAASSAVPSDASGADGEGASEPAQAPASSDDPAAAEWGEHRDPRSARATAQANPEPEPESEPEPREALDSERPAEAAEESETEAERESTRESETELETEKTLPAVPSFTAFAPPAAPRPPEPETPPEAGVETRTPRPKARLGPIPVFEEDDFLFELRRELSKSRRVGRPLTLILIEVSDLSQIVELLGKHFRSQALWHVAEQAVETLRDIDLVGLLGSRELVALAAFASDRYGGERIVARIQKTLGGNPISVGEGIPAIVPALSFGIATFPEDGESLDELIERATGEIAR